MKIVLLTEGNNHLGLGHVVRCISIYQAFEVEGHKPKMFVFGDKNTEKALSKFKHKLLDWIDKPKIIKKCIEGADIVVVDSMLATNITYDLVSKNIKVPIYLDDSHRLDYKKGLIVNRTIGAKKFKYKKQKKLIYLLGTRYLPLTKSFWYSPILEINKEIKTILITFGGSDPKEMTLEVVNHISKKYPKLIQNIIVGKSFNNVRKIKKTESSKRKVHIYPSGEKMKELMLDSDIAISAGGQTLYELARLGVPTIAVGVVDNQKHNLKGLEKEGFIDHAGFCDDQNLWKNINKSMKTLKSKRARTKRNLVGRKLVDGYGSVRIVNYALGLINSLN
jgi:UDP-2,4-diacetamido-2,4,6-trideoxy-beta-L-altropyranose hydrolase